MTTARFCDACGERIIRPYGRHPPLDRDPDPQGTVAALCDALGQWQARTLKTGEEPRTAEKRYALHSGSCPGKQDVLPVTDLETWRARKIQTVTPAKTRRRGGRRGRRHAT